MPSKTIPLHKLGKNGPTIPAQGLGLMGLSISQYGAIEDDEARFQFLDRALELGNTFWDTSDLYGDSEELLGKWFKRTGKRDQIFLATKFGFIPGPNIMQPSYNTSAEYTREACEKSLAKMNTDHIDLFYIHHPNVETPIEETMRALAELQSEGKIKHIGLSHVTSAAVRRAHKIAPIVAVQAEYGPFTLDVEGEAGSSMLQTCRELGIALVCYSPLGRGLLTTTFKDGKFGIDPSDMRAKVFPRLQEQNREENMRVVQKFAELAAKKRCTITQLALAWVVKQGEDIIPIPGTKRIEYLEENWGALDVDLSDDDEKEIRRFVGEAGLQGHQNPEMFRDTLVDTKEETL